MTLPLLPDGRIDRSGWTIPIQVQGGRADPFPAIVQLLSDRLALADAHDALVMELASLRSSQWQQDAERYRWLRQFDTLAWGKKGQMFARAAALADLDQVIDAGIFAHMLRNRHD